MASSLSAPVFYTESVAAHYDRLVDWVVQDWEESPRSRMGKFVHHLWTKHPAPVASVLELCCGTGLMLHELVIHGYTVTGLDQSAPMLQRARTRLGTDVALVQARLPEIPVAQTFDAVISTGAGFSYLPLERELAATFESVARVLKPGGSFVFDTLSRTMIHENMPRRFGNAVLATDLGEATFIWKFSEAESGDYSDLTYIYFVRDPDAPEEGPYTRGSELHRMYAHDRDRLKRLARKTGFCDISVFDNYTSQPAGPDTLYDTWTLTRR